MANTITDQMIGTLITAAQFATYENSIARVVGTTYDVAPGTGNSVQVPVYASMTAGAKNGSDEFADANTGATSATLTMAELGIYNRVKDMDQGGSSSNVMNDLGMQAGMAVAEGIDLAAFANFSSFTGGTVGVTTADLGIADVMRAASLLRAAGHVGRYSCVLNPLAALPIKTALAGTLAGGERVLGSFYLGTVAGVDIYESSAVTRADGVDTGTEEESTGAVFVSTSIGVAMRGGIEVEQQRSAKGKATDVVVSAVVGSGIINAAGGVQLIGKAA